ncbi:hypothetical protein EDC96DRAFT_157336 [Choanephora cucurbitarum]|nr:hypothetical protein EDC96DRAFT_157336 [Choanephora cucurbitarum]
MEKQSAETNKFQTYQPNLNREFSTSSHEAMASDAEAFITQPVKRGRSLVRPERERVDPNHRQFHYRQAAIQAPADTIQPSRTGNQPQTLTRRGTTKSVVLRRGKSVLGREEKGADEDDFAYLQEDTKKSWKDKLPRPWMTYCYLLTCCIPPQLLSLVGK